MTSERTSGLITTENWLLEGKISEVDSRRGPARASFGHQACARMASRDPVARPADAHLPQMHHFPCFSVTMVTKVQPPSDPLAEHRSPGGSAWGTDAGRQTALSAGGAGVSMLR